MDKLRKSVRLEEYDYSWAGYYFVTVVSHQRKNIFGKIDDGNVELFQAGMIVEEVWQEVPFHFPYVEVDVHIIMPNHFHGIIVIRNIVGARHASPLPPKSAIIQPLGIIVGSFKSAVTKRLHDLDLFTQEKIWQRSYYEHVIRDERDYQKVYDYIESNPINWALDEENITQN
jgi:REP element-mobilizing transposase RayT